MKLKRLFAWTLGGLVAAAAGVAAWDVATYDKAAWSADFARLKRDMAQNYANLDWIASHRRLDIAALAAKTQRDLDGAHSRLRAYFAIRDFVAAFGDPHLKIEGREAASASSGGAGLAPPPPPAGPDCEAAGYDEEEHGFKFPFDAVPGWRQVSAGDFPAGMIGRTGVIRIGEFGEQRYLSACRSAFRDGMSARALQLATRAVLQTGLRTRIAEIKRAGAERILVDLSGNGGGSEWVSEAVGLFTGKRMARAGTRLARPGCDRSGIWEGRKVCPGLAEPKADLVIEGAGAWTGPVLVLIDGGTASASEDFAAWLKDNGIARLVGEKSYGAGCGYVDGGAATRFEAAPFQVKMPNCARFLRNGLNEIEGIPPDVPLPMGDPAAAAAALGRLLGA